MPLVRPVADADDPALAMFRRLREVELRRDRAASERGLFIAEGLLVLERALAAGAAPRVALTDTDSLDDLCALLDRHGAGDVPVYLADPTLLTVVTGYPVLRGPLAALARPPQATPEQVLATACRLVVCEHTMNPSNLGVLFRCAAALGMDGVLLSPRSTDPLYRRCLRASMGNALRIPWARLERWPRDLRLVTDAGFTLAALATDARAERLDDAQLPAVRKLAVLVGSEGPGLSAAALACADRVLRIPMSRDVDSLNVAVAAALAFWEANRGPSTCGAAPAAQPAEGSTQSAT